MVDDYHHRNLRAAVLERAAAVVADSGPAALTLRGLASDLGVSHAAFRHHFGSREGVLAAVAADGFARLEAALSGVRAPDPLARLLGMGEAYVAFALTHPGHFAVMFPTEPDRFVGADPAGAETFRLLREAVQATGLAPERLDAGVAAAWGLVHGLAVLAHSGALVGAGLGDEHGGGVPALITAALRAAPIGGQPSPVAVGDRRLPVAGVEPPPVAGGVRPAPVGGVQSPSVGGVQPTAVVTEGQTPPVERNLP